MVATIGLVQHWSISNTDNRDPGGTTDITSLTLRKPGASLSGNLLVVQCSYTTGPTSVTCEDNIGNTYTLIGTSTDATNNQELKAWYCVNATAGVIWHKFTFNGSVSHWIQA